MYTRCLVLAQNNQAAAALTREPRSPFALIYDPRELPPRGGGVLGATGLHGFTAARALGEGCGDTYIVGWNLHPNDHALSTCNLSIPTADPAAVVRGTRNHFPSDGRPTVAHIAPALTSFMRQVMSMSSVNAIQLRQRRPGESTTMAPGASRLVKTGLLTRQPMFSIVRERAIALDVAPAFALAVADVESGFNPQAVSHSGAIGVMQLMPSTIQTLRVSNPFDPTENITAGLTLFKLYSQRYGSVNELLAAYHSGAAHLQRHGVSYSDSIYIHRVVEKWHFYEHVLNDSLVQEDPIGDVLTVFSPLKPKL